jgi:hypothetical protein
MKSFLVQAKGNGRIISWTRFKSGELVNQSRLSFSPTTILTDAINDMYNICRQFDSDCKIEIIEPNDYTTASFRIAFRGADYSIICERILVRGGFPFNPVAAEFGKNYDVLFSIYTQIEEIEQSIYNHFKNKYRMKEVI